jgi:hypothetical protein
MLPAGSTAQATSSPHPTRTRAQTASRRKISSRRRMRTRAPTAWHRGSSSHHQIRIKAPTAWRRESNSRRPIRTRVPTAWRGDNGFAPPHDEPAAAGDAIGCVSAAGMVTEMQSLCLTKTTRDKVSYKHFLPHTPPAIVDQTNFPGRSELCLIAIRSTKLGLHLPLIHMRQ